MGANIVDTPVFPYFFPTEPERRYSQRWSVLSLLEYPLESALESVTVHDFRTYKKRMF